MAHWSTPEWIAKSRITAQNRRSETGGPGTGLSKHTGGSRSTVEHSQKMAQELHRDPNSWEVFRKLHKKKDGTFVDATQSINKKRRMYGLGSHASTLYPNSFSCFATSYRTAMVIDHVADERIRLLEEEIMSMRENEE
ncbi:uncharacterized protein LOC131171243 [Hevea brasiliensis]|uniref:uncharacterized protein LOC131171243 n=1 Tax=Hevea brasiliensis TaxID=3981 RepID=UPI0025DEBADD|nr:uncharacterized protein LOC131171243 [Hevea brasiliensis]